MKKMEYSELYNKIIDKIKKTRKLEKLVLSGTGIANSLFIIIALMILATLTESFAYGSTDFRTSMIYLIILLSVLAAGFYLWTAAKQMFKYTGDTCIDNISLRIGEKYDDISDKLCNSIQLIRNEQSDNKYYSQNLSLASFAEIGKIAEHKDFTAIIKKTPVFNALIKFSSVLLLFIIMMFASSSLRSAFGRVVNHEQSFLPPAPFSLEIIPGDSTLLRNSQLIIKVKVTGNLSEKIFLKTRMDKQTTFDTYELKADTGNTYIYEIKSIKNSITYFAQTQWLSEVVTTDTFNINVINLPIIRSINGKVNPPTYTGRTAISFDENDANITALRGSRVNINVFANKELESAKIYIEKLKIDSVDVNDSNYVPQYDTLRFRMRTKGRKAYGRFYIMEDANYFVKLIDTDEQENTNPIKYNIKCLNDNDPFIVIDKPLADVKVTHDAILPISISYADDYGFSYLRMYYRLTESRYAPPEENFSYKEIAIDQSKISNSMTYIWDLNKMGITPDDKFEYYFEIADNDVIAGPKIAKTNILSVKLPSYEEIMKENEQDQNYVQEELKKALKEAEELAKEMAKFNREMLKKNKKKELNWAEKKKAEEILQRQNQLKNKMKELSKKVDESSKKMAKQNMMSPETMEMYKKLQDLMKQVDSPELRERNRKMQEAMKKMSADEMKKAMEKYKFNEDKFKKSIERTMKMLKRIQAQQKADALAKTAEELAKKQKELAKEAKKTNTNDKKALDKLAKKQDRLKDALDNLEKETKKLEDIMKELGKDMPMDKLDKAKKALNKPQTEQKMNDAKSQMQKGDMKSADENQQQAAQNMQDFAKQMQELSSQLSEDGKKEAIKKLTKAVSNLQDISKSQEKLAKSTKDIDYNSTQLPQKAREQAAVFEQVLNVGMALNELAEKSFAVTPDMMENLQSALESMKNSVSQISERRTSQAAKEQINAMGALNKSIAGMQSMMSSMKKKGGACKNPGQGSGEGSSPGFGQKMQQMAAEQQALNQAMQKMMQGQGKNGKGSGKGGLSPQKAAEMKRMGKKQGKTGKSMRELAKEQEKYGGADKKQSNDLKKLAKEMEEVAKDMQSGRITPETMKRQERILNRMLDATRSVNDRDFEKKREAKSGKDFLLTSPDELDYMSEEGRKRVFKELMKRNKQAYTKDYEELIKRYFEALENIR